mgnify:CR=1 FL=1
MATIRKRGNSYQIRVSCGYKTNGEQLTKTITYKPAPGMTPKQIQKELERQAVLFEEKCRNGVYLDGNIKLADFMEKWFSEYAEKQLKAKTVHRYKGLTKRILPAIGHIRLDRLQPHHLIEFYGNLSLAGIREDIKYKAVDNFKDIMQSKNLTQAALSKKAGVSVQVVKSCIEGRNISVSSADKIMAILPDTVAPVGADKALSAQTIRYYHMMLSSMLSTAVEWQIIPANPCDRVKAPKIKKKEAQYLDEIQAAQLIECLDSEPLQYKTMIMLFLYSGMRRGELCGLEWADVDFKRGLISITKESLYLPGEGIFDDTTKNKTSERVIRIPPDMITLLKEHQKKQAAERLKLGDQWKGSKKIFTSRNGRQLHPDSITKQFKKFVIKNNLPDVHLHSLRHTNATLLIAGGTNIRTVANRLGHASPTTTGNIYAHAIKTADELAAETLADILNPVKRPAK